MEGLRKNKKSQNILLLGWRVTGNLNVFGL
jgi:hypothetical protein